MMELGLSLSIQPSPLATPPLSNLSFSIHHGPQINVSSVHKADEDVGKIGPTEDAALSPPDPSLHLHLLPLAAAAAATAAAPPFVSQNPRSSTKPLVWWSQCRGKRKTGCEERTKGSNSCTREEEEEEEEEGDEEEKACSWRIMSDEEENGTSMCRKKLRLSKEQSAFLEDSFKEHHTLNPKQKLVLAKRLKLRPRQVEVWFQNRRARTKLKQTEVECEYLRRWCETLREENKKIQKEVQELRALKASQPLYMQIPATTLTICPSCDRTSSSARHHHHPPFLHPLPGRLHL